MGEERRWATVLFADLKGFTSLSERMDPEDVRALIDRCMRNMGQIVERFGGSVERVIGDALMALFGARLAHEDDAERAVRAGLEIQRYCHENPEDFGGLSLRVGVNTGEMMFAPVGPDSRREFTVLGDAVNVAARLQTAASPGGVLVGEETYLASRRAIRYDAVEALRLKGKEELVPAWQALEALVVPLERGVPQVPIVGRDAELTVLLETWETAARGRRPSLITVIGPPGIGKTRLSREFARMVEGRGGRVILGRSLPFGENSGYSAFSQQVKGVAGILESDSTAAAREKLIALLEGLLGASEADEVAGHLALMMGMSTERAPADRQPLFFSARRLVESLARRQPVALVFEDLHWADTSLLDLAEFMASRIRDVPVLFLAMARPELLDGRPRWGEGVLDARTLRLVPLSRADARSLAVRLLPDLVAPGMIERVVSTAAGNPLFLEELAASVAEKTSHAGEDLPRSIKGIIAARLDALPAPARSALLNASVVGKVFWRGALAQLDPRADLDPALDVLEARDLIRREPGSRQQSDREYLFKHMLIRDVAYSTLPKAARQDRHATVARFIEEAAGERVAEWASLLAHHWREAGDNERAIGFLLAAARKASLAWAQREAVSLYTEALELMPDDDGRRVPAQLDRATAMSETGDYQRASAELERLIPTLGERQALEAVLARARIAVMAIDPESSIRFGRRAVELADALGDSELRPPALAALSHATGASGAIRQAVELADEALATWRPGVLPAQLAFHYDIAGLHYYWAGRYEQAVEYLRRGYDRARELHTIEGAVRAGGTLGLALTGVGRHEEAIRHFDRVLAQGRELEIRPRWTARALNMSTEPLRDLFELDEARRRNDEAIEMALSAGFPFAELQARIDLLFADLVEGDVGRAEAEWPSLWEMAVNAKGWHGWVTQGRLAEATAEIAVARGDLEAAVQAATAAMRRAHEVGRPKYEITARLALGAALHGLRRYDEAVDELRKARSDAEQLGHPPTRWRAGIALGESLVLAGGDGEAEPVFAAARDVIERFAGGLPPERQARFLSVPAVTRALATR